MMIALLICLGCIPSFSFAGQLAQSREVLINMDDFLLANRLNLWLMAKTSAVVVARTENAGAPPLHWSEHLLAAQQVTISVEETISGKPPAQQKISLSIPVVKGSRIATSSPGLVPWVTQPGSRAIYFLQEGMQIADEDLSILKGDLELINWLRELCHGPIPAGAGSVLYQLVQAAETDPQVKSLFTSLEPAVIDVLEGNQRTVRLTVSTGKLRIFTGIRLQRVAHSRQADVAIHADAAQLGKVLTGEMPIEHLHITGKSSTKSSTLLDAMGKAGRAMALDPGRVAEISAAAGLAR